VFVSYAREDKPYVVELDRYLRAQGIEVWYDHELHHGDRWQTEIQRRIRACSAMIVVETDAADQSEWVPREITHAIDYDRQILPLLLRGKPLMLINDLQHESVEDGRMPGSMFIEKVRSLCNAPGALPLPAAKARELPPVGTTPMTWLPYRLSDGSPHYVFVDDGIVRSDTIELVNGRPSSFLRPWRPLGGPKKDDPQRPPVSRIAATPDGSYLVAQTATEIAIAQVKPDGVVQVITKEEADPSLRLVAVRQDTEGDVSVEVLLSTPDATEIWPFTRSRGTRRRLPFAAYAAAGFGDGFLVIKLDGTMLLLGSRDDIIADLGEDWVDIDVGTDPSGAPVIAALRFDGARQVLWEARVLDDLAESNHYAGDQVRAVRATKRLPGAGPGHSDAVASVWPIDSHGRPIQVLG
jgi:hypothetical protein